MTGAGGLISAYNMGLALSALTSALVISRIMFWLSRERLRGWSRATFANALSFAIIVTVLIVVRGILQWEAVVLHLVAQAVWLVADLIVERRAT